MTASGFVNIGSDAKAVGSILLPVGRSVFDHADAVHRAAAALLAPHDPWWRNRQARLVSAVPSGRAVLPVGSRLVLDSFILPILGGVQNGDRLSRSLRDF